MMCACEEQFAHSFLAHQIDSGTDLLTQRPVPVTLGFQAGTCNSCRGLPEEAHPMSQRPGRTSKIARYYWREIALGTIRRFGQWAEAHGHPDWLTAMGKHKDVHRSIEREVIEKIRQLHQRSPKYVYTEESQSEVLRKHKVEVIRLEAAYLKNATKGFQIVDGGNVYSPEQFSARHFERLGYEALFIESVPFHALFAILMWPLIQDPADPEVRLVGFGDRAAFEERSESKPIWTFLPSDFGTSGYAERAASLIESHFASLPDDKAELLWLFDYWVEPSSELQQYLWAYRPQDVARAREIVSLLPFGDTTRILRYLIGGYWERYCGWPDLLLHNQNEFFFAEVKSSKDELSEDQKNWIRGNSEELHLPFKLIKIHKRGVVEVL